MAKAVFTTERSERHQADALKIAPEGLEVVMLRSPGQDALAAALAGATYLISERAGRVDAALLAAAPDLKLVLRLGSLDHDIDLEACRAPWRHGLPARAGGRAAGRRVRRPADPRAVSAASRKPTRIARAAADDWAAAPATDENALCLQLVAVGATSPGLAGRRRHPGLRRDRVELARAAAGLGLPPRL